MEKFLSLVGLTSDDTSQLRVGAENPDTPRHNRYLVGAEDSSVTEPSIVTFVIYARNKGIAEKAITLLEHAIEDDYIERKVSANIIKDFDNEQVKDVKKLEDCKKVKVDVDKTNGEISIRGLSENVSIAINEANIIIRAAEHLKQTKQKAKLVTDLVQWFFIEEDKEEKKLVKYPPEVNFILESALKDQKNEGSFLDSNGTKYIVDFNSYEEYPVSDPTDKVQVLRKSKLVDQTFDLPANWASMDQNEDIKIVQLATTDQEYQAATTKFLSTVGSNKVDFIKVEKIQNKTLYQQFVAKKKLMEETNPKSVNNEKELWHGFGADAQDNIIRYGFNRSYCREGVLYGLGVYFAVNVHYSINDGYSKPDANNHKRMFLCKVLTGEYCNGVKGMRVPPAKQSGSHILFDTVTDNIMNPAMFIIFHDSQAYPEYLFTFKKNP